MPGLLLGVGVLGVVLKHLEQSARKTSVARPCQLCVLELDKLFSSHTT